MSLQSYHFFRSIVSVSGSFEKRTREFLASYETRKQDAIKYGYFAATENPISIAELFLRLQFKLWGTFEYGNFFLF